MAYAHPSPALPSPSHPMAKTGYGKRSAGDEDPHADPDFAHLSPREREMAVFIDHLDEGHAMGYKAIAAEHPRYGQQATRTSLRLLSEAGHLKQIREHITVEDNSMRWVTRTYWSRTPRSAEWWAKFARERKGRIVDEYYQAGLARAESPEPEPEPTKEPEKEPDRPSVASVAYRTLAELRDTDRRMPLSESDCRSLESLVAEWLSRGSTPQDITRALTDGLPSDVTNPGGLARRRLEDKMPPKKARIRQKAAPRRARVTKVIMCCVTCDADELTTKIVNGLCPECRAEMEAEEAGGPPPGFVPDAFLPHKDPGVVDVTRWADQLREAAGLRPKAGRNT